MTAPHMNQLTKRPTVHHFAFFGFCFHVGVGQRVSRLLKQLCFARTKLAILSDGSALREDLLSMAKDSLNTPSGRRLSEKLAKLE
jgi:hypothetical protein